jgi:hypothetical protein
MHASNSNDGYPKKILQFGSLIRVLVAQENSQKLPFVWTHKNVDLIHSYIAYELASSFTKLSMNLHLQKSKVVL